MVGVRPPLFVSPPLNKPELSASAITPDEPQVSSVTILPLDKGEILSGSELPIAAQLPPTLSARIKLVKIGAGLAVVPSAMIPPPLIALLLTTVR